MLWIYKEVLVKAARRTMASWMGVLALIAYALILVPTSMLAGQLGIIGGLVIGLVLAACWSSYLEIISQAVSGSNFRLDFEEFKRTFGARFLDVISVMFAFWLITMLTAPLLAGPRGPALSAILGFAMAFFFNAVPELLYQGNNRSFGLLIDSAKFVMDHPVAWMFPNVLFAALVLLARGELHFQHPVELLIAFGATFSSPLGVARLLDGPLWSIPLALLFLHFAMIFRGLLFRELQSGNANPRLREFQRRMRG